MPQYKSYLLILLLISSASIFAASHHPEEFLKNLDSKNSGKLIYDHFCANCHAEKPLISLGAPRFGKTEDWSLRVKQGLNLLFKHTDEGFNAMPARGGCFECTDEQLLLTIIEMLPKEYKKALDNDLEDHKKNIK